MPKPRKVYLDSSVYGLVADNDDANNVSRALSKASVIVVLSGVNLQEAYRAPVSVAIERLKCMAVVVDHLARRPSGYLHSLEFLGLVGRFRPQWLRRSPNNFEATKWFSIHERQWKQARRDPESVLMSTDLAHHREVLAKGAGEFARYQKTLRGLVREHGTISRKLLSPQLDLLASGLTEWESTWRSANAYVWSQALFHRNDGNRDYYDFSAPFLDLQQVTQHGIWELWLKEATIEAVPRNYLQVVISEGEQLQHRISSGNALDALHCDLLFDVDVWITADRALEKVASAAISAVRTLPRKERKAFGRLAKVALVDRQTKDSATELLSVL